MIVIDDLQEYKELYYKEIEHSERLNNKTGTSITFLTILGSGQILLWNQLKNFSSHNLTIAYILICVVSLVLFLICLYKFYHTFSGYEYHYFPIKEMALATIETRSIAGRKKKDKERAEQYIYNMYSERFLNDAIHNRNNNTTKAKRYKSLTNCICFSFITTIIAFSLGVVIDYYDEYNKSKQEIKIQLEGEISMSDNEIKLTITNNTSSKGVPFPETPKPQIVSENFTLTDSGQLNNGSKDHSATGK